MIAVYLQFANPQSLTLVQGFLLGLYSFFHLALDRSTLGENHLIPV